MTTTDKLSPRAIELFDGVTAAMQPAEEMQGPDDYVALMQAIIDECTERQCGYQYSALAALGLDSFNQEKTS